MDVLYLNVYDILNVDKVIVEVLVLVYIFFFFGENGVAWE